MNKIGIIGNGFVGNAIHQGLKEHFDVLVYDLDPEKKINTFARVNEALFIFVCVPTPMKKNGAIDCSIIVDVVEEITKNQELLEEIAENGLLIDTSADASN